jgi:hypothetical protein
MNPFQKAVLLVGLLILVFILLFMDGMNYDGIGLVAAGGLLAVAVGIYALRNADRRPASDSDDA